MSVLFAVGETQEGYYQPLEKAELVREGGDVTILCYSRMRYVVMQAVQTLEKQGFDPEVLTAAAGLSHTCPNALLCIMLCDRMAWYNIIPSFNSATKPIFTPVGMSWHVIEVLLLLPSVSQPDKSCMRSVCA